MLRGYFRFNNKSCFFSGYTELLTQKNWHNWSVLMEDVCINNKLLSKEALLVECLFIIFLCNYNNHVGLPGWELKMQSAGESNEMLASLEGDDTYTAPKTTA